MIFLFISLIKHPGHAILFALGRRKALLEVQALAALGVSLSLYFSFIYVKLELFYFPLLLPCFPCRVA